MEDAVGLGNHVRHDAITGATTSSSNNVQSLRDHATVFVHASTADRKDIHSNTQKYEGDRVKSNDENTTTYVMFANGTQDGVVENATNNHHTQQHLPRLPMPSFPPPPPHPNSTNLSSHPKQQALLPPHFPKPPPAPPNVMFPPPPPNIAPPHMANLQSAMFIPPHPSQLPQHSHPPNGPLHVQQSLQGPPPGCLPPQEPPHLHHFAPPPGLPPQFPLPPPPGFPPNFGPSTASSFTVQSAPLQPPTLASQPTAPTSSIPRQGVHLSSPPCQLSASPSSMELTQQMVPPTDMHSSLEQKPYGPLSSADLTQQIAPADEKRSFATLSDDPIEKARAIARRFHIESTQRQSTGSNPNEFTLDNSIPSNINYTEQRQAFFQKERTKLDKFRLKNLEYVMKHDEMELRQHVDCMNKLTNFEEKRAIQLQLAQEQQRQRQMKIEQREQQKVQAGMLNASSGGIGSRDQKRAERVRKREHLEQGTSNVATSSSASDAAPQRTSLYLTNLPTDGSTTERILHSLFSSYGRLDRVTMYRHRSTGDLKGDGLIVFGRDAVDAYMRTSGDGDLVEAVCLQMNGAELPCGTALGVQPADMDYRNKVCSAAKETTSAESIQSNRMRGSKHESCKADHVSDERADAYGTHNENALCEEGAAEDLDDFFASLV